MKQNNSENYKIHDSKGGLYYICPFLDSIRAIVINSMKQQKAINVIDSFSIMRYCESIKLIAEHLRGGNPCSKINARSIHDPYNFSALLNTIKIHVKNESLTEHKLIELINIYQ